MDEKITPIWKKRSELNKSFLEDYWSNNSEDREKSEKIEKEKILQFYFSTSNENIKFNEKQIKEDITSQFPCDKLIFFDNNPNEKIPDFKKTIEITNLFGKKEICVYKIIIYEKNNLVHWKIQPGLE